MTRGLLLAALCGLTACQRHAPETATADRVHYLVGDAWHAGANWFYPRETFDLHATCVATVGRFHDAQVLADGVVFHTGLLTGGHQTLQLPSVVQVTNLLNGRRITLRLDDRGPADPARGLELSPEAARLLGASGPTPVAIDEDSGWSQALARRLGGGDGTLAAAPVGAVSVESLPPPGSALPTAVTEAATAARPDDSATAYPDRPPPGPVQMPVGPVAYVIDGGSFSDRRYAVNFAQRIGGRFTGSGGRRPSFEVIAGPYARLDEAEAALDLARRVGLTGARLTVEQ